MHNSLWTRGFISVYKLYEQEHDSSEKGLETVMRFVGY